MMIKHSVLFTLNFPQGSPEEKEFLKAAAALAAIPGVENFESLRQISPKNNFEYGLSMQFADRELYDGYSNHPAHLEFIQRYWITGVKEFLEIDCQALD